MNIMVSKEECLSTINKFINCFDINDAILLLNYLCDIKESKYKEEILNTIGSNIVLLNSLIPNILEELERHFGLIRIIDKNNKLILVY